MLSEDYNKYIKELERSNNEVTSNLLDEIDYLNNVINKLSIVLPNVVDIVKEMVKNDQ